MYIIRDTKEKKNFWEFPKNDFFEGTISKSLKTGDYSIEGFEDVFSIERKATTGELAGNIYQGRFERELERFESFQFPFIVCQFTLDDVLKFPNGSGIPKSKWPLLKIKSHLMLKRINEFMLMYKTKIIFAGNSGKIISASLFKRIIECSKKN